MILTTAAIQKLYNLFKQSYGVHITPLVNNSLGVDKHTHMHAHTHTYTHTHSYGSKIFVGDILHKEFC